MLTTSHVEVLREVLKEAKENGWLTIDISDFENLMFLYEHESQLCLENAKIASEALKENAKLKEDIASLERKVKLLEKMMVE